MRKPTVSVFEITRTYAIAPGDLGDGGWINKLVAPGRDGDMERVTVSKVSVTWTDESPEPWIEVVGRFLRADGQPNMRRNPVRVHMGFADQVALCRALDIDVEAPVLP